MLRRVWPAIALAATVVACVPSSEPPTEPPTPTLAEPYGACRITADCRVGVCNDGRCLPSPNATPLFDQLMVCVDNMAILMSANGTTLTNMVGPERFPLVDCAAWGATCIERRGCALPPGARCAAEGKRLLPCGSGDVCVDEHCVVDDASGIVDARRIQVGEQVTMTVESQNDIDCITIDSASSDELNIFADDYWLGISDFSPVTGEVEGIYICFLRPGVFGVVAMAPGSPPRCIDDHTISETSGERTCPEDTVCRPDISYYDLGVGCVPALNQSCANDVRCGGYCQLDIDRCIELPSPLPQPFRCTLSGGKLYYGISSLQGYLCADGCRDGYGCVDTTPTSHCTMWHVDPAGGLARCEEASVSAWSQDDFPGFYFTAAPLVSPGTYSLTSAHAGDVDCLTVIAPVRGVLVASTSSGTVTPKIEAADIGAHVSFCVEGHTGTATLKVEAVAEN